MGDFSWEPVIGTVGLILGTTLFASPLRPFRGPGWTRNGMAVAWFVQTSRDAGICGSCVR
jgi:hypothetical protein